MREVQFVQKGIKARAKGIMGSGSSQCFSAMEVGCIRRLDGRRNHEYMFARTERKQIYEMNKARTSDKREDITYYVKMWVAGEDLNLSLSAILNLIISRSQINEAVLAILPPTDHGFSCGVVVTTSALNAGDREVRVLAGGPHFHIVCYNPCFYIRKSRGIWTNARDFSRQSTDTPILTS